MTAHSAARPARPYPGLRPFEAHEWSIFFGRERMIDDVIGRLANHRLIVIHGASGSGKSSLVRAGVLPKLERQYLRHGAPWTTCAMRPSGGPLWNLATELARLEDRADDVARIESIVVSFSRRDATLAMIAGASPVLAGKSLCILVDQFEELFRFEKETSREEAELFLDLLSRAAVTDEEAASKPAVDVRVVVTMRSEFLGECARFDGLAETINLTQYLVPRMDDEAIRRAVIRPAQLFGGQVPRPLADRLIGAVRGREDELPVLQHGLMLLWDEAAAKASAGQPLVLEGAAVDAAGGLGGLLSAHADAVTAGAAPDAERLAKVERLFRELTDVNAEGSAIRRPRSFRDLLAVVGGPPDALRAIIDAFRDPGVSFLTPYAPAPIIDVTVIDISHEALIRCWRRIAAPETGWLKKEFDDGLAWRSLRVEALAFARDRDRILSPAAAKERSVLVQERNEAWSRRYGGGWEAVDALLQASREAASHARRKAKVMLIGLMALASTSIIAALTAGAGLYFYRVKSEEAYNAKQVADMGTALRNLILSQITKNEEGCPKGLINQDVIFKQAELSANLGNADAASTLGYFFSCGIGVSQNYKDSFRWYQIAAKSNNAAAMRSIGLLYEKGLGLPADLAKAREWYEKAAAGSDGDAMRNLGILYENGHGVAQDSDKARQWYEKAAANGDAIAMTSLGLLYESGSGPEQNFAKARDWYEKAAAKNNSAAMTGLGLLYANGLGVTRDINSAREWYEKAAATNNAIAMTNLGLFYENGLGVARDIDKARSWYEKAAGTDNAIAMTNLGLFYEKGLGVTQDFGKARNWYEKAAATDNAIAMTNLGALYEGGQGVKQDFTKARDWYEKAAATGNAVAMRNLGLLYESGQGVTQDFAKARDWYEKAAATGNAVAMRNLGLLYENGRGVTQDFAQARDWYEKPAATDNAAAMTNLGLLYENGLGASQDYVKAREWYERAASSGDAVAMINLGLIYERGLGVEQDYAKARIKYEKAIEEGNNFAKFNLADLYRDGKGVERNLNKAIELYEDLGKSGNATALNDASWAALFAQDFRRALADSEQARKRDPSSLALQINYTHALMFLDRVDEARAAYLSHRGEKISSDKLWQQVVLEDFEELRSQGAEHPLMAEISKTFEIKE